MNAGRGPRRVFNAAVVVLTAGVAVAGALPYAVGWNDGSRLATVESLVDHGTLAIDRSVFVHPGLAQAEGGAPFGPGLLPAGTADKVFVDGRFYSDKAPVPAVAMSALYWGLQRATGLVARERVNRFAYLMTVTTAGASYVAAAAGMFLLVLRILGSARAAFVVALSFAFATIAPVYSRAVNIHIVLLALATGVVVEWHRLVTRAGAGAGPDTRIGPAREARPSTRDTQFAASTRDLLVLGALGGAAYACDFGIGPHLLGVSVLLAGWICRRIGSALLVVAGAAPLLILHHVLNYQIGGTLGPIGAVPEYLAWSGSPFASYELTGGLHHASARALLRYAADLLVGARGFVRFNLPLILLAPALPILFRARRRLPEWPAIVAAYAFMFSTWCTYAVLSTNFAGRSISIRWFVPWLAPACLVVAILLREQRVAWPPFLALTAWGCVVAAVLFPIGPWDFEAVGRTAWLGGGILAAIVLVVSTTMTIASGRT